jgi:hypothetical protein
MEVATARVYNWDVEINRLWLVEGHPLRPAYGKTRNSELHVSGVATYTEWRETISYGDWETFGRVVPRLYSLRSIHARTNFRLVAVSSSLTSMIQVHMHSS